MESASRPKKPALKSALKPVPAPNATVTAKRKRKIAIAEGPPNIRTYEVNNGESNTAPQKKNKTIKGSLRTRDPAPAPASSLIDFEKQPKPVRKAIKKTLRWRSKRAIHAKVLANIEHELLNNNNADDDMCHIIRIFAAVGEYEFKKVETPYHIRAFLVNKYKRALSEANYKMLKEFNTYLHQKLTDSPSNNNNAPSNSSP
jgi:hypothetical protein